MWGREGVTVGESGCHSGGEWVSRAVHQKQLTCHAYLLQRVFDVLFSEDEHKRLLERGDVRLSYKAMQGALMIFLYRWPHAQHCMCSYINVPGAG